MCLKLFNNKKFDKKKNLQKKLELWITNKILQTFFWGGLGDLFFLTGLTALCCKCDCGCCCVRTGLFCNLIGLNGFGNNPGAFPGLEPLCCCPPIF